MKITDESMAKTLGWKWEAKGRLYNYPKGADGKILIKEYACRHYGVFKKGEKHLHKEFLPKWTTSLDAIVAEIEARELEFIVQSQLTSRGNFTAWVCGGDENSEGKWEYDETAPLALCAALLGYLRENG